MSEVRLSTEIVYFGQPCVIACDAKCDKAWGMNARPTSPNSLAEDDFEYFSDDELGEAPEVSDIEEGDHNKPVYLIDAHNKWCARECERSVIIGLGEKAILPDFSQRLQNISQ